MSTSLIATGYKSGRESTLEVKCAGGPYSTATARVISFPLILAAVALRRRVHEGPERQSRWYVVSGGLLAVAGAVLVAGTVVTGTGLHAGDIDISRIPFDPAMVTQLHGDFVFLLVGRAAGRAAATAARARALDPGFRS